MKNTKVTVASMRSVLIDPQRNLERVKDACAIAHQDGARMLFLPELMLTGHGGHRKMTDNAEQILAREARRTQPDYITYIPSSWDDSAEDRTNEHDPITRAFFFPYKSPNAPEGISKISITKDINPNNQPIC